MKTTNKKKCNRGFLLIESLVVMGIFAIFISITFPLIKEGVKIKKEIKKNTSFYKKNYFLLKNIKEEVNNSSNITVFNNGNSLKLNKNIYENGKLIPVVITYEFKDSFYDKSFTRQVKKDNHNLKAEVIFDLKDGKFFYEDNFLKVKFIFQKSNEEEFIWK